MGEKSNEKDGSSDSGDDSDGSSLHLPEEIYNDERDFNSNDSDLSEQDEDLRPAFKCKKNKSTGNVVEEDSSSDDDEDMQTPAKKPSSKVTFAPNEKDLEMEEYSSASGSDEDMMDKDNDSSDGQKEELDKIVTVATPIKNPVVAALQNEKTPFSHKKSLSETPQRMEDTATINYIKQFAAVTPGPVRESKFKDKKRNEFVGNDVDRTEKEYTIYLINKPKSVEISDLRKMKLPTPTSDTFKVKVKTEEGSFEGELLTNGPLLLHVPLDDEKNVKNGNSLFGVSSRLAGTVTIRQKMNITDIGPINNDAMDTLLPLRPIKRKATRDGWENLEERLVAFGVKRKKKHPLPGLTIQLPQ